MKFKIIENKNKQGFKEGFYVKVKSYMGDADYHDSFIVGPFPKDKVEFLEEVVETLNKVENRYDPDDYDNDKNFRFWFKEEGYEGDEESARRQFINTLTFENEAKKHCYGWAVWEGMNYTLSYYEIYYLDATGIRHGVEIVN
ncbi:hypothetical protein D3C87_78220 [compost metagenome]